MTSPALHLGLANMRQFLAAAVGALNKVLAHRARLAARHAERAHLRGRCSKSRPSWVPGSARAVRRHRRRASGRGRLTLRESRRTRGAPEIGTPSTSGSVRRELVICVWTTLVPLNSGPAPDPPAMVS